ncbi:hypothetical protein Bca52824_004056 [Brassica carinata]|uniref:Uncharacterized protein n=1 Tax=Brassica carinata TaxID=52824 RepID=A0A8X7WN79_BRACI|nr:hypothetical protein Bca52824_004056 [Brassica carinata]
MHVAVPRLRSTIPIPDNPETIMHLQEPLFPKYTPPSYTDILSVEAEPDVSSNTTYDDDEVVPLSTTRKSKPLCGNSLKSRPALTKVLKPRKTSKQRETVLKPRKTARKTDTVRKQRRISNYFHVASSSRTSDEKILELLSGISEQLSNIQKKQKLFRILLKRQSTPSRLKRSALRNRSNIFTAKKTLMEEDHTFSHSPVVSQYAAQKYGSTALNKEPSSETAVRETGGTTPVHTSPIHASPNHKPSIQHHPDHEVSDHNIPTPNSPFTPKDTPIHPPKTIKTRRSTSEERSRELSDSSPARERPKHIPSVEENILAKELYRSESVPALDLICPLNQSLWDRFETVLSNANYAFHITPSKFDFSNNFLVQLAKPSQWTTTYNKSETHLFKWVDEALLDEIRIVDAKRVDLLHELQALTGKVNVELDSHRLWLVGRAEEMRNEINENMVQLTKAIDESTSLMKAQIDAKVKTHTNSKWSINQTAAAMAMIGAMTYLYWKLL